MENKKDGQSPIRYLAHRWFISALGAMAQGLFASLIIGVILDQLGKLAFLSFMNLTYFAEIAKSGPVVGAAIGVAVAVALGAKNLTIFSCAAAGAIGYLAGAGGGPVSAYVAAIIGTECGELIAGKTKVDIILIPFVVIVTGGIVGTLVGAPIAKFMVWLGSFINKATELHPGPMGFVISVVMGICLTLPISSAAIAMSLNLTGLAAAASAVGCCANMIGFAVASFEENKWGGLFAQGLGTSMLQMPNIVRKPIIWLPAIVASAILGPIVTTIVPMSNTAFGAGMGTSGLVGQIGAFTAMAGTHSTVMILIQVLVFHFILPALIAWGVSKWMRKKGWIKHGDMLLDV